VDSPRTQDYIPGFVLNRAFPRPGPCADCPPMVELHTLDQSPTYNVEIRTIAGGFKVPVVGGYARAAPSIER
jgi:hypothetical protein